MHDLLNYLGNKETKRVFIETALFPIFALPQSKYAIASQSVMQSVSSVSVML
jgi:hypothetical protein